jgi:oligopeptide/dipeptide ABC transporter ATP-binding protein
MADIILETVELKKYFQYGKMQLHAVDGINLKLERGKTIGVVGESGCGKSTLGRTILGLLEATGGKVLFEGEDITSMSRSQFKRLRTEMQIIFQDPYSSINPRMSVGKIIGEPLLVNGIIKNRKERKKRVLELMEKVGLADKLYDAYPHELDGGRRQRIGVARALAVNPKFIVCDEPVSALDVSIQAQILNLMMDLQEEFKFSFMFITHDLSVVKHISDQIMVMYLGQCVEMASSNELFNNPQHPYTKALLSAIPVPSIDAKEKRPQIIKGEITSPMDPPPGCRFAVRCPLSTDRCIGEDVELCEIAMHHYVACDKCKKQ